MTEREFHRLYLPLAETLYRVAFYILESKDEAEDAVQEVYVKLWSGRDTLENVQNPKAYSISMLRNLCIDRIRKASRTVDIPVPEKEDDGFDQDAAIDQKERLGKVLAAVKSLPDLQREILLLRTVEGLSYEEIAGRTGKSYLTLRVLLSRARATLKNAI
ncbi:MAG: RNA polymerase sigma factor [Bacteroidales bacterium]|nr:RNA polymerase sigma factor [Bacteroidales bacterium]